MNQHNDAFLRAKGAAAFCGYSRSMHYQRVSDGLVPPPLRIGPGMPVWPVGELAEINRARVAGKTDDEIKALVQCLLERRKTAVDQVAA